MKRLKHLLQHNYFYYILLSITILYSITYIKSYTPNYKYNINADKFLCILTNYIIIDNKLNIELKCKENLVSTYYFKDKNGADEFKKTYSLGDKVSISGSLNYPSNNTVPNTFNYKKYLSYKNVNYVLTIKKIELIKKNNNIFFKIKSFVVDRINSISNNEYLYAFILGNSKYFSEEVSNNYKVNTVTHLFALSGLHVSIFALILSKLLKNCNKIFSFIVISSVLLLFSFIASFTPSILRATILYILMSVNRMYNMKIKPINILYIVFSIMMFIKPLYIYSIGFILSFTITFFIILFTSYITVNEKIKSLIYTSIVSMLGSVPILINNFYKINIIGFINNLFFIPYVSYVVFPFSLLTFIFPFLSQVLKILTNIMEYISKVSSSITTLNLVFSKLTYFEIVLYYLFLILFIVKRKCKYLFLLIILMIIVYIKPLINKDTSIYYLDVKQGDAILIRSKNTNILIDTGGKMNYGYTNKNNNYNLMDNTIIPFMMSIGIRKIDYLILTHGDYDHMGEAINLVENFKVENLIFNCGSFNELEKELISVLEKKKTKYYSCIKELNIDNDKLYFLNDKDYGNENDNSIVLYTEINNKEFLFMGDASVKTEKDIMNKYNLKDIDVIKVGHHGSKTSSSEEFIDKVNPKYSLISVGKNNRYGHPNSEVLKILDKTKIYRTDQDGSIMFKIKNNKLDVSTCSP